VTGEPAAEHAPLQQRVDAAARTLPALQHLVGLRVVVHDVDGTAWLWASRRRWHVGRWSFGPPVPDEIRISPHAAETACDDALRGLIAHEYAHLIAGHAESDWRHRTLAVGAVLCTGLASALHRGWLMAAVFATVMFTASLALAYSARLGELHAEGMAAQMVGARPVLAALTYATANFGPGRRSRWPLRLFDTYPSSEAREREIIRCGRPPQTCG
jgi:hypothetical protein